MDVFTTISLIAVAMTLVNFVKFVRAGVQGQGWNGAVSMVLVFVILLGAMWLYGNSQFGVTQVISGVQLTNMALPDLLIAALAFTGPACVAWDFIKAIDNTNSAAKPPLVPPSQRNAK